eukprot:IDg7319t1
MKNSSSPVRLAVRRIILLATGLCLQVIGSGANSTLLERRTLADCDTVFCYSKLLQVEIIAVKPPLFSGHNIGLTCFFIDTRACAKRPLFLRLGFECFQC